MQEASEGARACSEVTDWDDGWIGDTLSGSPVHDGGFDVFKTKYSPPSIICFGGSSALIRSQMTRQSSSGSGTPMILSSKADSTTTGSSGVPANSLVIL